MAGGRGEGVSFTHLIAYLVRLLRPEFWLVTIVPMYIGYVVASHDVAPRADLWVALWLDAWNDGVTSRDVGRTFADWWRAGGADFSLAAVALGPLMWGSTLLYNDYWDLHADRANPRRRGSPLVRGRVTPRQAHLTAWALAFAGLVAAAWVNLAFFVFMLLSLALSVAYSAPPLRLKARAGGDVLVNAVGIGIGCTLAGWSIARPWHEYPWPFLVQGVLVSVGVYLPSVMVDHGPDKAAGIQTFAVRFGLRRTFLVGFAFFAASCLGAVAFAAADYVIPRGFLPVLVPFSVVMALQYWFMIGNHRDMTSLVRGIVLGGLTMFLVNMLFVAAYVGLWRV